MARWGIADGEMAGVNRELAILGVGNMNALETLAWAILTFEGFKPGTKAWRHNNPGNLRSSNFALRVEEGYAVFREFSDGWMALCADLKAKCKGAPFTRSGLGPDSTLLQLIKVWAPSSDNNKPDEYAKFVAEFCAKALRREITVETTLRQLQTEPPAVIAQSDIPVAHWGES